MLDDIIEIALELILDGAIEAAGSKRVPLAVRIVLVVFLALFFLALFGLLLWVGVSHKSILLILLTIGLMLFIGIGIWWKIRKHNKNKK